MLTVKARDSLILKLSIVSTSLTTAAMVLGAVGAKSASAALGYVVIATFCFVVLSIAIVLFVKGRPRGKSQANGDA